MVKLVNHDKLVSLEMPPKSVVNHLVRCRGGMIKKRALRVDRGNFSWASENRALKTHILNVVYNASNNELVRTQTLVKNCIIQIDATPFKQYYMQQYGIVLGKATDEEKVSKAVEAKRAKRALKASMEDRLRDQFKSGKLLACLSSRPGQCGRADGYILEGAELDFYSNKMKKKRKYVFNLLLPCRHLPEAVVFLIILWV